MIYGDSGELAVPIFLYSRQASIYDRKGRLLWFSPAWFASNRVSRQDLCGLRYFEFMAPGESSRFLRWLATPDAGAIEFHFFSVDRGEWVLVRKVKTDFDDHHVLCLGEQMPARLSEINFSLDLEET